uniref:F-box domain-containing protein n=1 Tax=Oryza punctata TaxID=4537 RepID=A0A0E0M7C9_ORYPU
MEPGAALHAYLPDDLVADILTRLPARSVCRFHVVCKSWRALATERQLVLAHTARDRAATVPMNHHHREGKVIFQIIKAGDSQWREIAVEGLAAVSDTISKIDFHKQEKFRSMVALQCATTWVRGLSVLSEKLCSIAIPESLITELWVLENYHEHHTW